MPPWITSFCRLLLALSIIALTPVVATAQHVGESPQTVDGPLTAAKAPAMNNDSVMKMAKAGLGDELIIETINRSPASTRQTLTLLSH